MKPEWYLVFLMVIFAAGIVLLDWYIIDAYGEYEVIGIEYNNYEWMSICQLINLEPYYDCPESVDGYFDASGEEWMIFQLKDMMFPDPVGEYVFGFAVYNDDSTKQIPSNDELSLCRFFPAFNGTATCSMNYMVIGTNTPPTCYSPYPCVTVFEHEIKHLTCKCDWHDGLEGKRMVIVI